MQRALSKRKKMVRKSSKILLARRTRVLSGRVPEATIEELRQLYPSHMTESDIVKDLVQEKLTRAKLDKWIEGMRENFNQNDIDLDSFR